MIGGENVREAIEFFFDVIEREPASDELEAKLRLALDRLALAVNYAAYTFDDGQYPEAKTREYTEIRDIVSERFPDCGFYNIAADISEEIGNGEANVGDAIDDICDIAGDLEEVLWRWENNSPDEHCGIFPTSMSFTGVVTFENYSSIFTTKSHSF